MDRMLTYGLMAAAAIVVGSLGPGVLEAQTTFTACRVPDVGAIYMIGVEGAPSACLDETHIEFSWTEGSGSLAEGSVTTTEILDGTIVSADIGAGAVTTTAILDGTVGAADLAADAVDSPIILDGSVTSTDIADGTVANVDLAPGVASVTRSVITYSSGVEDTSPTTTPEQLRVIGSFTKNYTDTDIQVVWNSHVLASGGICNFHVRVDGVASPSGSLGAVSSGGDYNPVSTTNVFSGLATGPHEITVWSRGVGATSCFENPGNYPRHVVVTEYNPG